LPTNNVYTNLLAQRNLREAANAVDRHPREAARPGADLEEAASWRHAANDVVVPFDEALGVHPQSESFTSHQRWDFEHTSPEQHPLLLHFPYYELYRKQVIKQADLVLALMDLHDLEHNTGDGVHIGSLAGVWLVAVAGFGGMRDHDGTLSFAPRLPPRLERLRFRLLFRGRHLNVDIRTGEATYTSLKGAPLEIVHHGEPVTVSPETPVTRDLPPAPDRPAPTQPHGRAPARRSPGQPDLDVAA
jgi:alpha,alpha-trehalose phosphorylase